MIHPDEINHFLMLDPGINAIIAKSNTHMETTKKIMGHRLAFGGTALYHTVIEKMLGQTTVVTMKKKKPVYPERKYLGNIIMNYLPDNHAWKITITNGGSTRKNAKLQIKIKEIFYLRRLNGNYFVDRDFTRDSKGKRIK